MADSASTAGCRLRVFALDGWGWCATLATRAGPCFRGLHFQIVATLDPPVVHAETQKHKCECRPMVVYLSHPALKAKPSRRRDFRAFLLQ
eukprot:6478815-Amphidinium_carterae.1